MIDQLQNYINDTRSAECNFALGLWYDDQGHTAGAAGFYVRTAVHAGSQLLAYEALLRLANCFTRLGGRVYMCKGILLRAISLLSGRPEAYFLLSRLYEADKEWQESYTFAVMGQQCGVVSPLRTNVDYPGRYALVYQQAIAAWWVGLYDESLHLLRQLKKDPAMLPVHVESVRSNLANLSGTVRHSPLTYCDEMYEWLRVKFPGARDIERNYSQMYQDMFVLTMLNGRRTGTFLEIGCGDPVDGSNTKLLEEWGWTGTSVDIDSTLEEKFSRQRRRSSSFIVSNATRLDFNAFLQHTFPKGDCDYLQIDIEPPLDSLRTLLRIPFEKTRFAVITFEHDDYRSSEVKQRSRAYLRSHGYVLIVGDVAINDYESCEDWWVHPALVDGAIISKMLDASEGTKKADSYMLSRSA